MSAQNNCNDIQSLYVWKLQPELASCGSHVALREVANQVALLKCYL